MTDIETLHSPTDAIVVTDLVKRYGRMLALDSVSLTVPNNTMFALLGPNGAGKTTLIHILCTILQPDGGQAWLAGTNVQKQPLKARQNIGVVFQEPSLDDRLTAYENLDFHGRVYNVKSADRKRGIDELLALVELEDWRHAVVRTFSSGMKRRLEIARALLHSPRILFLDEPTVGLDAQSRAGIWAYLDTLRKQRDLTIVVTTHYIEEVENCDKVSIIDHGKIIADGSPLHLKSQHGKETARVIPRDAETAAALTARYGALQTAKDGSLIIDASAPGFADAFLAEFGSRIRQVAFDKPSLESVFLTLTGRELRDRTADEHEKRGAAARRGRRS
ncbi:multidrug ABC transporter ATP-binding protein [Devosia yakushimensis]|uniref:Multidrug ABC transporter ATP-binding protein n=1 Tax=Devosia yakushimensis TaxID=470028 RepID=A0ABQ5UC11_9HYPH|nr:ATP-binding cassette domain-containing protein [Devosia yakushimensis]GLQ08769.1 multidrug ABC transporter ATP-binding protein [Devosia yakushimensis]